MSHIPDMNRVYERQVAVGWLHPDHEFPTGPTPPAFLASLKRLAACWGDSIEALNWPAAGGFHTCEFCERSHASGTFGVPAGDKIFWVPEMIAHYVEKHAYLPPEEFIAAVLACPSPGTRAYPEAVAPFVLQFDRA